MSVSDGPHTGMPVLLRVHVEDLNDNWPQFEHLVYNVTVTEVESRVNVLKPTKYDRMLSVTHVCTGVSWIV